MAFTIQKPTKKTGFTLIELIIVVAIMGLLFAAVAFIAQVMIGRARVAKAQGDLNRIAKGLRQLEMDTGTSGNKESLVDCPAGSTAGGGNEFEITATDNRSGLFSEAHPNGAYSNWKGPYLEQDLRDPWGRPYVYDGDYYCQNGTSPDAKGCEDYGGFGAGRYQRVIYSRGAAYDASLIAESNYDSDNIVLVLCTRP